MQTYTLNFTDPHYRRKYFDSELKSRLRILKSVSLIISLLFLPSIVINVINQDYLICISLILWIMFHWVNIFIIYRYEIWLDYSQFINLMIALCILFQFSHQNTEKENFESAVYGFAFQTYSVTMIMIGTNYLIDCFGQLIITLGLFLVLNLEIGFSNCVILFFCYLMICQLKYQNEKSKRLLFYFKEKEKRIGQSLRDTTASPLLIIKHKKKSNSLELFTKNDNFQNSFPGIKDHPTLTEFTNKLFIKKELAKQSGVQESSQYSWQAESQKQFVSLNTYLQHYCQALQKKESSLKQQNNALLYLLDSQFGVVDSDKILKNKVEDFIGIFSNDGINTSQTKCTSKKFRLRIGCK